MIMKTVEDRFWSKDISTTWKRRGVMEPHDAVEPADEKATEKRCEGTAPVNDRSSDCEVICLEKCAGICGVSDFDDGCRFDITCWLSPTGTIDSPSCKCISEVGP